MYRKFVYICKILICNLSKLSSFMQLHYSCKTSLLLSVSWKRKFYAYLPRTKLGNIALLSNFALHKIAHDHHHSLSPSTESSIKY